jgi:hypothetical protein
MPPLTRASTPEARTVKLPARDAPVLADVDVLVVGGGPAGIGAAIGAADAGADVLLAERYGFVGGCPTAALVMPLMSYHTQQPSPRLAGSTTLLPTDHGPGKPVIAGVVNRLVQRLVQRGGAIPPSMETGYVVPFDPEVFKSVALELLDEAGDRYLLHALASGIIGDSKVEGVVFETKSGPVVVTAKAVVDCTGDADVAALAGAPYEVGRDSDGLTSPMTLMFRMSGFDRDRFGAYVSEHPDQWLGVHGLWNLVREATLRGDLNLKREDILFFATPHDHEVVINSTRITGMEGTNVCDLSYAEREGRRQMDEIARFLKRYVPGFGEAYVIQSGTTVGVRGTRRIVGDYVLTADDVLQARKFDDVIARCAYPIDMHNPDGPGTIMRRLPPDEAYDIPLRSLLPTGVERLIVAGKCISGTYEAHSSLRAAATCMATGQAAGVCAALAVHGNTSPHRMPVAEVQRELLRQGADLRGVV